MSRITQVSASNLKGRNFSHPLDKFTLITGPNATGKTAVTDALTIALTGNLPKLGKRNADTFRLASGQKMAVGVEFNDGSQLARTWQESRGSVKAESSQELVFPAFTLDANEYFQLSDKERMKLVFRIAPGLEGAVGLADVTARIKSAVLSQNSKHSEAMLAECCKLTEETLKASNAAGQTMQEWLEATVVALKAKLTEANAAAKRMTGTAAGLTEIGRESVQFNERELKAVREKQSAALRAHQSATGEHAKAMADAARRAELEIQLKDLETLVGDKAAMVNSVKALQDATANYTSRTPTIREAIQNLDKLISAQIERDHRRGAWEIRVADMERELAALPDDAQEANALVSQIAELTGKVNSYVSATLELQTKFQDAKSAVSHSSFEIEGITGRIASAVSKRDALLAGECCPTCLASGNDGWRIRVSQSTLKECDALEALAAIAASARDTASVELKALEEQLARSKSDDLQNTRNAAQLSHLQNRVDAIKAKEAQRNTLAARLAEAKANAPEKSESSLDLQDQLKERKAEAGEAKIDDGKHAENLAALAKSNQQLAACVQRELQVAALRGEFDSLKPGDADALAVLVNKASEALGTVTQDVDQLAAQQRQADAAKGEQHARMKALEAAEKVEAEVAAVKAAVATVEDLMHDLVAKAFGALLTVANRIAAPVLRSPLEYREGEIGRQDGRHWITARTFSGTEQAITYAAFSVALASESKLKLCLLDEIGRLDRASRAKLFKSVAAALADGTISQFIGVLPELGNDAPDGATVIITK